MTALPPDSSHPDPVIQRLLDWLRSTRVQDGTGTVTWPGGSATSNLLTINFPTAFQRTPRAFAQSQSQAGLGPHATYIEFVSTTQVGVRIVTVGGFAPPNSVQSPIVWRAEP